MLTRVLVAPLTKAAGATLVLGWLPLLVVATLGPEDANPIGLGLLAMVATPIAFGLFAAGVVQGYLRGRA